MFTKEEYYSASDAWGFNCGPGALCAMMGLTPNEIRPNLFEFERKKYTNPKLMKKIIRNCGWDYRQIYRGDVPAQIPDVQYGLARIQWIGPWTEPTVPMRKRQRYTHWIGLKSHKMVFDINAVNSIYDGWLSYDGWRESWVPWILSHCVPNNYGSFWPTHVLEIYSTLDA
jgi:hypothetical protein